MKVKRHSLDNGREVRSTIKALMVNVLNGVIWLYNRNGSVTY